MNNASEVWIITDLDGTLSNHSHRLHLVQGPFPDWEAFNWEGKNDCPYWRIVIMLQRLHAKDHGTFISIITGREECCRQMTEEWLKKHNIIYDELLMRPTGDHRPDREYKWEIYEKYFFQKRNVWLVLDDRNSTVELWRSLGLTCLQVREGDY